MSDRARKLALSIGSCENFIEVLNGGDNECRHVIEWQAGHHDPVEVNRSGTHSVFHRPEPWAGNITEAKIMFLSSNPSFESRENFPTFAWPDHEVNDFFMNRFSSDVNRRYGAIESPPTKEFDQAILKDGSRTKRVTTWYKLRSRAAAILQREISDTFASRDYVMTEVVHCKSRREVGVAEALPICVSKWFAPVLATSAARLIIVSGKHAGIAVTQALNELTGGLVTLGPKWGSWQGDVKNSGKWPVSWSQLRSWREGGEWEITEQMDHIAQVNLDLDGLSREFTFMWMPHPVRMVPQKIDDPLLFDPRVLAQLRSIVRE